MQRKVLADQVSTIAMSLDDWRSVQDAGNAYVTEGLRLDRKRVQADKPDPRMLLAVQHNPLDAAVIAASGDRWISLCCRCDYTNTPKPT